MTSRTDAVLRPVSDLSATWKVPIYYVVKPGDTLTGIIREIYQPDSPRASHEALQQILADNSGITDPNRIRAGQVLYLDVPPAVFPASIDLGVYDPQVAAEARNLDPLEREAFYILTELSAGEDQPDSAAGHGSHMVTHFAHGVLHGAEYAMERNVEIIRKMVKNYEDYVAKRISDSVYNRIRLELREQARLIQPRSLNIKPREGWLYRAAQRGEIAGDFRVLSQQSGQAIKWAKMARWGGRIVVAIDLGIACHEIAHAKTNLEKNEIFVETLGGLAGGMAASWVLAGLLVSGPAGWAVLVVIGLGAAAVGMAGGWGARKIYDEYFQSYDIVDTLGITSICREW